jgi:hypothetical protein
MFENFAKVCSILGLSISDLCRNVPEEKIFDSATSNTPEVLSNSGESSPPATMDIDDFDSFDLSQELADILATFTPPASTEAQSQARQADAKLADVSIAAPKVNTVESAGQVKRQTKNSDSEKRSNHRHPLHWRVAIINKGSTNKDIYHGRTHDLSMLGMSILLDRNVTFTAEVVVLLEIPPMQLGQKKTIVEIQCSTTYTLLDSVHSQFRLGMKYISFKGDGQRILSDILSTRHILKETPGLFSELK